MKAKLPALFLYYSTAAALFITISGFLTARRIEAVLFQIFFLPVTIFFLSTLIKHLRKKAPAEVSVPREKGKLLVIFVIFLALFALGFKNVVTGRNRQTAPSTPPQSNGQPQALIFEKGNNLNLVKTKVDEGFFVNIREKPSVSAKVIGKAKKGQEFEFLEKENSWYKVKVNKDSFGFISADFVEEVEKE